MRKVRQRLNVRPSHEHSAWRFATTKYLLEAEECKDARRKRVSDHERSDSVPDVKVTCCREVDEMRSR